MKPKIEIKNLENYIINTKTLDEFKHITRILGILNFPWFLGYPEIGSEQSDNAWNSFKERTYIGISEGTILHNGLGYINAHHPLKKEISFQDFCEKNNITSNKLNEINNYFN